MDIKYYKDADNWFIDKIVTNTMTKLLNIRLLLYLKDWCAFRFLENVCFKFQDDKNPDPDPSKQIIPPSKSCPELNYSNSEPQHWQHVCPEIWSGSVKYSLLTGIQIRKVQFANCDPDP